MVYGKSTPLLIYITSVSVTALTVKSTKMATEIKVQVEVLNSLSNDYRKVGQEVSESCKVAANHINRN